MVQPFSLSARQRWFQRHTACRRACHVLRFQAVHGTNLPFLCTNRITETKNTFMNHDGYTRALRKMSWTKKRGSRGRSYRTAGEPLEDSSLMEAMQVMIQY